MSWYSFLLFAHISGALGFVSGIMLWGSLYAAMRRARRVEHIRYLALLMRRSNRVTVPSVVMLLAAGITMTITSWGFETGWIDVALGSVMLLATFNAVITEPRIHALTASVMASGDGPFPLAITAQIQSRLLNMAMALQLPYVFGIVFLMVIKPTWEMSLGVMAGALLLGLVIGWSQWLRGNRSSQIEG